MSQNLGLMRGNPFRLGAGAYGLQKSVEDIVTLSWILSLNTDLIATVGNDAVQNIASTKLVRVWHASLGLISVEEDDGEPSSEGMRRTGTGVYVNNDGSGNKLTPSTTGANGEEVFEVIDPWVDSQVVAAGGQRTDFDGAQCKYYSTVNGGTTSGTGVADDTGVTDWVEVGNYNNIKVDSSGGGWLTHIKSEPVAATNLDFPSQDFSGWAAANGNVSTDTTTSPNGDSTADSFISDNVGSASVVLSRNMSGLSASTIHNMAIHIKNKAGVTWVRFAATNYAGSDDTGFWFNLQTGEIGQSFNNPDAPLSPKVESAGDGWWRPSLGFIMGVGDFIYTFEVRLADSDGSNSFTGDGVSGIYVWQDDLVAASSVSSSVPTTSGTATRAADIFSSIQVISSTKFQTHLAPEHTNDQTFYEDANGNALKYTGTDITYTDGVTTLSATVSIKHGTIVGIDFAGRLYVDGNLEDTDLALDPTHAAITALNNLVGTREDDALDLTSP